jgi:hypothetical protein
MSEVDRFLDRSVSVLQPFRVRFSCGFRFLVPEKHTKLFCFKCSIKNFREGFFKHARQPEAHVFFWTAGTVSTAA